MKTVTFKGQEKKQGADAQKPRETVPKTLKRLKIGVSKEQARKMAYKTLNNGGVAINDPEDIERLTRPRGNRPTNLSEQFNQNASALMPVRGGRTPLEIAAENGDVKSVQELLNRGSAPMALPRANPAPHRMSGPKP